MAGREGNEVPPVSKVHAHMLFTLYPPLCPPVIPGANSNPNFVFCAHLNVCLQGVGTKCLQAQSTPPPYKGPGPLPSVPQTAGRSQKAWLSPSATVSAV